MRMTITRRLLLGFGSLLLIMVGIGIVTSVHVRTTNEAIRQITNLEQPTIEAAYEMEINMLETAVGVLMYLETGEERYRELMRKSATDVGEAEALYHRLATTQTERELGARFRLLFQEFEFLGEAMMQNKDRQEELYGAVAANIGKIAATLQERIETEVALRRPGASNRVGALGQLKIGATKISLHLGNYLLSTKEEKERVLNSIAAFKEDLAHLATLLVSEEEKRWIGDLERLFNQAAVYLQEILAVSESLREDTEGFLFLRREMDDLLDEEMQVLTRQDMLVAQARAEQTAERLRLIVILLTAVVLIVGSGAAVIGARGIIGPMRKLVEGTEKIGRGVLDHRVKITTKDEFGELARAFNQMTEKRQRAEEKIEHLNLVLQAIRNVNQLIIKEKNLNRLLQGACDRLIETNSYHSVWVALMDKSGGLVTSAGAGLGEDFLPLVARLRRGELSACVQRVLSQPGVLAIEDPASPCTDCPLAANYGDRGALAVRLEHGEKVYGMLSISLPAHLTADDDERALLEEVAGDIAFALRSIELEEEREQAEEETRLLLTMTRTISESQDFHAALEVALRKVCETTGWDFGEAWIPNDAGTALECSPAWYNSTKSLDEFRRLSEGFTFPPNTGLPGRVWSARQSEWIPDASIVPQAVFTRAKMSLEADLKAALGVPIIAGDEVLAVLMFFMFESRQEDERLVALVSAVAAQLGSVIRRKRAEDELAALNLELEEKIAERTKELEATVRAAEAANRVKSQFLAGMSHELRTPLNAVIGFSQVLQGQYFGEINEKQAEYVNDILESGKHLLSLINDILDLSKIEAGKMELELFRVDLKELLEDSLIMIEQKCLNHQIGLALHISQNLEGLSITADERRLKQVMFNLLSNAAKFTPDGGEIAVEARQEGEELLISISDTGIGIAPEYQERIFEEFYQVRGGIRDKAPGTGLGLALSMRLVEIHGGRIWVESEGEGKGSRFSFVLPMKLKHLAEG